MTASHGRIIPIEVKAGTRGQMQSLRRFLNEHPVPHGIRVCAENFSVSNSIETIPLYAIKHLFAKPKT